MIAAMELVGPESPCPECGEPTRMRYRIGGSESTGPLMCRCSRLDLAAWEARRASSGRAATEAARRLAAFFGADMSGCTFERDDAKDAALSEAARRVASRVADGERPRGLILTGGRGTGKTYMAAAMCNRALSAGRRAVMGTVPEIANAVFCAKDKNAEMARISCCDLLAIDDMGAQRAADYMDEQLFEVVDAAYRNKTAVVVTTNLSMRELHQRDPRVFERLFEICDPIEAKAGNRRLL